MIKIEDQVSRIADRLEVGAGLDRRILEMGVATVLRQDLPPRDSIILQEARRLASLRTPRALKAWDLLRERLSSELPRTTFELWIASLQLVGEAERQLLLTGADQWTRTWVERRYAPRMGELVKGLDFRGVVLLHPGDSAP